MEPHSEISKVNHAIMFGNFTTTQLESIISAVKFRRGQLIKQAKNQFRVGTAVKFYSSKRGCTFTGTVQKVAIKYVTVNTGSGLWKVPANMLEAAE